MSAAYEKVWSMCPLQPGGPLAFGSRAGWLGERTNGVRLRTEVAGTPSRQSPYELSREPGPDERGSALIRGRACCPHATYASPDASAAMLREPLTVMAVEWCFFARE